MASSGRSGGAGSRSVGLAAALGGVERLGAAVRFEFCIRLSLLVRRSHQAQLAIRRMRMLLQGHSQRVCRQQRRNEHRAGRRRAGGRGAEHEQEEEEEESARSRKGAPASAGVSDQHTQRLGRGSSSSRVPRRVELRSEMAARMDVDGRVRRTRGKQREGSCSALPAARTAHCHPLQHVLN